MEGNWIVKMKSLSIKMLRSLMPWYGECIKPPRLGTSLSATAQVELLDAHKLETLVPPIRSLEERINMTANCRDADGIPKVKNSGAIVTEPDGTLVQIMHNGIKVLAGGYYGEWMMELITRCKGHHEPQEEVLFGEVIKHLGTDATMFELGGYWSYYSIWFLNQSRQRRSFVVEPDPKYIEVGRTNARLNGVTPVFIPAFVGPQPLPASTFVTESSGNITLPCVSVDTMMDTYEIEQLDFLHCDAQGIELHVLESISGLAASGRLNWVMVSTHSHQISNDPLTHQRCLATLRHAGAIILAEHDVQESFSGDGLILAKFGPLPTDWETPNLSYNRYSESLFRNPLYDLAATSRSNSAPFTAAKMPLILDSATKTESSKCLTVQGGLLVVGDDCALGRAGDRILLPFDKVMFPIVMANCSWASQTLAFLEQHIDETQPYAVLDIGANVGLFTRQLAIRFTNLTRFICVEADPENFRVLEYNVASLLSQRVALYNVALSNSEGQARFFRDSENFGNYSLNDDAMRDRPFNTVVVESVATDLWMSKNVRMRPDERLIWKSDTQGYDELIISMTPISIWNRISYAIVELWRIKKPDFDKAAFRVRIDCFPNKSMGVDNPCTTEDVMAFLSGEDWHHEDLFLWR